MNEIACQQSAAIVTYNLPHQLEETQDYQTLYIQAGCYRIVPAFANTHQLQLGWIFPDGLAFLLLIIETIVRSIK